MRAFIPTAEHAISRYEHRCIIDIIGKFLSYQTYSHIPVLNEASDENYGAHTRFPSPYPQILYVYSVKYL